MADDELKELLDQLDTHTAENDASVERAKESLEATLSSLKLTPEEEAALAGELAQLRDLGKKLDETTIEIAAFGMVSRGKSSVLNALMGQDVFKVGATHGTTVNRAAQRWQHGSPDRPGLEGAKLVVVDTPGIDEVGGEVREALARDVARHADLILFVVSGDMQRTEIEALSSLREAQKPIILVFNQIDRYPEVDRDQIYAKIKDERVKHLVRPDDIVMTAARPDAFKVKIQLPDGTTQVQWERPAPLIDPLKIRILDVLEREGKALVALNTLLIAGDLHADIVARKIRIRDDAANRLIWNFSLATGAAVALNPIPVVDIAGGLAVDVGMIVALSNVYGIPLTRRTAASLVRDMMLALGAMGARWHRRPACCQWHQVVTGRRDHPHRRPRRTAHGPGLCHIRPGPGRHRRVDFLYFGARSQDLSAQGCQWGPRYQDRHPANHYRGQSRLGHRPIARRPQKTNQEVNWQ